MGSPQKDSPRRLPCPGCGTPVYPWSSCPSCGPRTPRKAGPAPSLSHSEVASEEWSSILKGCGLYFVAPILGLVVFCVGLFNASVQSESVKREKSVNEGAERARRAQIQADADRGYREWRAECEQLERHLTPGERAEIADEKDHWDSIERAGRAGRRLGEAIRDR